MKQYIVFWILAFWVQDSCPDTKYNPYTNSRMYSTCLVNHGHYERDTLVMFFSTHEEAARFVEGGSRQPDIEKIWVDSTIIPKSEPTIWERWEAGKIDIFQAINDTVLIDTMRLIRFK